MRDFARELAGTRCWDRHTERIFRERGEPLDDCILQNRAELLALCRFIAVHRVRSYLEIGLWTGRLLGTLHGLFRFEKVAGCDDGYARRFGLELELPTGTEFFVGDSGSEEFATWRRRLGHFDLVFIDGDHSERGVRRDFELQCRQPHRFLAFHDIRGCPDRRTAGVARFWASLRRGYRLELVAPHREAGLTESHMGIGIWSARPAPGLAPVSG